MNLTGIAFWYFWGVTRERDGLIREKVEVGNVTIVLTCVVLVIF